MLFCSGSSSSSSAELGSPWLPAPSEGSAHQTWQRLLPAASGVGDRPGDYAASRPAASGVSIRRRADVERLAGCRGVQDRPPAYQTADEADGIEALYRRRRTTKPEPGHKLPVSAARDGGARSRTSVGYGHHLHPDGARLRLSGCCARLVQPPRVNCSRILVF